MAGLLINEGIFGASPSEPVLEVIEKLKRRFAMPPTCWTPAIASSGMSAGRRPTLLVYRVICTDEDAMHWPEEDIGNLRVALNALVTGIQAMRASRDVAPMVPIASIADRQSHSFSERP